MKLILKKDIPNLGEAGQVVTVKPGFGRNYLLPQDLAYEASEANLRRIEDEQRQAGERARRDYLEARRRASQLEGRSIDFHARASEEGKLFGSITVADIVERLNAGGLDFELDRRTVLLEEPIKATGSYRIPLRLFAEVEVEVEVRVEREDD